MTAGIQDRRAVAARRRVGVIGGGVIGVTTASWLLRDGHDVTLIEPGKIGGGSSFGNAGCMNASSVVPMSMPGMVWQVPGWLADPLGPLAVRLSYLPRITPWLLRFLAAGRLPRVKEQSVALRELLHDAFDFYGPLVKQAGAEDLLRRDGHIVVYRSEEKLAGDATGWQLRRDAGIRIEKLEGQALRAFDPALSPEFTIGMLIEANGHTVNPQHLFQRLADAYQRDGGRLLRATASGLATAEGRVTGIHTEEGFVPVDEVVVAAGAHSRPFIAAAGDHIPLDTERGYHVIIRDPEVMPRATVMDAEGKFVATPMAMGLRIAGTVEFGGVHARPDWKRAEKLLVLGRRLFPGLAPQHEEARLSRWMGFRPSMPDSLPVIGRSPRLPNLIYAFGHGHVGVAAGARTGLLVADIIGGRTPHIDISPFRPDRF